MRRPPFIVLGLSTFALVAAAPAVTTQAAPIAVSGEVVDGEFGGLVGNGFGDLKIDRITFTVTAGTTVNFDALVREDVPNGDYNGDGEYTFGDFQMNLYTSADALLVANDDGGVGTDGSGYFSDGVFNHTFAAGGTYYLAVGHALFSAQQGIDGYFADQNFGAVGSYHFDWRVTMTPTDGAISNVSVNTLGNPAPVPEPASLALLGLGSLALLARRRPARSE
jgi:hypothetical protein